MGFKLFVLKRVLQIVPTLFFAILITFIIIHMAPGDPARAMAGENASPESIEALRERWGMDEPLYVQFGIYLNKILHLDLGYSYWYATPVLELILERIPPTLLLVFSASVLSIVVGVFLGTYAGGKHPSIQDKIIDFVALGMFSTPVFWVGLLLIIAFAINIDLFPVVGIISLRHELSGIEYIFDIIWHLFLPMVTLSFYYLPMYLRITRASVIEVMQEDFIRTCRAIGLSESTVRLKHGLRNALIPVITTIGIMVGYALTGAIVTETVFGWPGLGKLTFDAISGRDYPLLLGIYLITSALIIVSSFVTDILYSVLDPRVKLS